MNTKMKIDWIKKWCHAEGLQLIENGYCGIGRECVGVAIKEENFIYPDYMWFNNDCERIDENGEVWQPTKAYHKHPCTAVLGRGKAAISQLYDWCKWFYNNHFHYKNVLIDLSDEEEEYREVLLMSGRDHHHQMVREDFSLNENIQK